MRWLAVLALSACLLLPGTVGSASVGPPVAQVAGPGPMGGGAPGQDVTVEIAVQESGDARWTVSMRVPLANETERRAFERLANEFRRGETDLGVSVGLFRQLASAAERATGRDMAIVDPEPTAYLVDGTAGTTDPDGPNQSIRTGGPALTNESVAGNATGVLAYRFTWTNFAARRGDELVVRDVFASDSVMEMLSLADDQTLVIRPPDRYLVSDATVGVTNGTLVLDGARQFEPGSISVVYRVAGPPGADPGSLVDGPVSMLLGALLALLAATALVYLTTRTTGRQSRSGTGRLSPGGAGGDPGPEPEVATGSGSVDTGRDATESGGVIDPSPTGTDDGGSGPHSPAITGTTPTDADGAGTPQPATGSADRPTGASVDPELLSDEERVLRLLDASGGRMRQSTIVERTAWSNAKVSVLLSSMASEGRVEKLRIGRENLISLPHVDPEPGGHASDSDGPASDPQSNGSDADGREPDPDRAGPDAD